MGLFKKNKKKADDPMADLREAVNFYSEQTFETIREALEDIFIEGIKVGKGIEERLNSSENIEEILKKRILAERNFAYFSIVEAISVEALYREKAIYTKYH